MAARDPVNSTLHSNLGWTYFLAGRWDEAIEFFQTSLQLNPERIVVHYLIGLALLFKGEPEAALVELSLEEDKEYRLKGTTMAMHALARQEEYQAELPELIERPGAEWPSEVAHVYAYAGDTDAAFEWLDKAVAQNEAGLYEQFLSPFYTSLHGDPHWEEFLTRVGSSPEQRDAIRFQITLPR